VVSSPSSGGGTGASTTAPWHPTLTRCPSGYSKRNSRGLLLRKRCEVENSPRAVLGGGGVWKMVRDGETSASNSDDGASLLHGFSLQRRWHDFLLLGVISAMWRWWRLVGKGGLGFGFQEGVIGWGLYRESSGVQIGDS
jgi:hypothetical protein